MRGANLKNTRSGPQWPILSFVVEMADCAETVLACGNEQRKLQIDFLSKAGECVRQRCTRMAYTAPNGELGPFRILSRRRVPRERRGRKGCHHRPNQNEGLLRASRAWQAGCRHRLFRGRRALGIA
jgi:hypothetical protein